MLEFERHARVLERMIQSDISKNMFSKSVYLNEHKATNDLHAVNDAAAKQIVAKPNKRFKGSKHPYFNRKPVPTEHGLHMDGDTLFKLGQIDVEAYQSWLEQKIE